MIYRHHEGWHDKIRRGRDIASPAVPKSINSRKVDAPDLLVFDLVDLSRSMGMISRSFRSFLPPDTACRV